MRLLNIKQIRIIFILALFIILFQAGQALALEVNYPPVPGAMPPQVFMQKIKQGEIPASQSLPLYIKYIATLLTIIAIFAATGAIAYGGILFLFSPTKPANLVLGKQWIQYGILSLFLLSITYLVLYAINPRFTIFKGKPLEKPTEVYVENPFETPKQVSYWEVPVGQLIEDLVLSPKAHQRFQKLLTIAEEVRDDAKNLRDDILALKSDLNNIECGYSDCQSKYRLTTCSSAGSHLTLMRLVSKMRCYCLPIGCDHPSQNTLYFQDIVNKIDKTKKDIAKLEASRRKLAEEQQGLIVDYLELKKAGMLLSLPDGVMNYSEFINLKQSLEEKGKPVAIASLFPNLPSILAVSSTVTQINAEADQLSSKNATTQSTIKHYTSRVVNDSNKIINGSGRNFGTKNLLLEIDKLLVNKDIVDLPLTKQDIQNFLSHVVPPNKQNILDNFQAIENSISNLDQKLLKKTITDLCEQGKNKIKKDLKEKTDDINSLLPSINTNNGFNSTTTQKLEAIREDIYDIENIIYKVSGAKVPIVDPATFYILKNDPDKSLIVKKETYDNQNIVKESARTSPLLVVQNRTPQEFVNMVARDVKTRLQQVNFNASQPGAVVTNNDIQEVVQQSITSGTTKVVSDVSTKTVNDVAHQVYAKASKAIAENFPSQVSSKLTPKQVAEILKNQVEKSIYDEVKTNFTPKVKNYLAQQGKNFIKSNVYNSLASSSSFTIANNIFNEAVLDLPDILSAKLVDALPNSISDLIYQIDQIIKGLQKNIEKSIMDHIVDFEDSIRDSLNSFVGSEDSIIGTIINAIEDGIYGMLNAYTSNYIHNNLSPLLEKTGVYSFQAKLESLLDLTVYDSFPKKTKDYLEDNYKKTITSGGIKGFIKSSALDGINNKSNDYIQHDYRDFLIHKSQQSLNGSVQLTNNEKQKLNLLIAHEVGKALSEVAGSKSVEKENDRNMLSGGKAASDEISNVLMENLAKKTGKNLVSPSGANLGKELSQDISKDVQDIIQVKGDVSHGVPLDQKINQGFMLNSMGSM